LNNNAKMDNPYVTSRVRAALNAGMTTTTLDSLIANRNDKSFDAERRLLH